MNVADIEMHEAKSLAQASSWMTRYGENARLLAGGTDLLVDLKTRRVLVEHVVSISRIRALRGVDADETGLRIGALTTPNQLSNSPVVSDRFPAILDATRDLAAPQIRNMATVGGNIASAVPSADLPPILLALGASVVLWSEDGERCIPLDSFFVGPRRSVREGHEILTSVVVPYPPAGFGAAYSRFALRAANACAVAGVAASVTLGGNDTICEARIALGAVSPTPRLVDQASEALIGQAASEENFVRAAAAAMASAQPISDIRASGEYRRELVGVLTRRALATALKRARSDTR